LNHLGDLSRAYGELQASFREVVAKKYMGCRKFVDELGNTTHEAHGSVLVESLEYVRATTNNASEHLLAAQRAQLLKLRVSEDHVE
jgi:hypothetical protein